MSFIVHISMAPQSPCNHIMPDRSLTWSRIGPKTMPAQPTWFQLLSEILDVLRGMEAQPPRPPGRSSDSSAASPAAPGNKLAGLTGIRAGNATAVLGGQRQWAAKGALRPKGPKRTCLLSTR